MSCLSTHRSGGIPWSPIDLPAATPLEQTDTPSPRSHHWSVVTQLGKQGYVNLNLLHVRMLTGFIVFTGSSSCWEPMSVQQSGHIQKTVALWACLPSGPNPEYSKPVVQILWSVVSFCLDSIHCAKVVLWYGLWSALFYEHWDTLVEGSLILCPSNEIVLIGSPLDLWAPQEHEFLVRFVVPGMCFFLWSRL